MASSRLSNPENVFHVFLSQKTAVIGSLAEKQKVMQEVDSCQRTPPPGVSLPSSSLYQQDPEKIGWGHQANQKVHL